MSTQEVPRTATRSYAIDGSHSAVAFAVRHLMIAKVRGTFQAVAGTIELPATGNLPTHIEATIQAASLASGDPQRDGHLKSPEFLDAETFPELTFTSTRIDGTEAAFTVTGDLTIHGITAEVVLEATFGGTARDMWGNDRVAYEARTEISRSAFGLTWNQTLEAGGVVLGDEVTIDLNLEAIATHA